MTQALGHAARYLFLTLFALFLAAPLVVVTGVSFNATRRMSFPPEQWGLRWWEVFFTDAGWMASFQASLTVAVLAAVIAVSVALPVTYASWRYRSAFGRWLAFLGSAAFMLPPVVMAVVFLIFWGWVGHVGRIENTLLSHAVVFLALPLVTLSLGFRSIDPSLVEAARTLGAREHDVFRTVVLPIVGPYLISGFAFVFVLSLNEYIIAYMVAGFTVETLPVKVFNSLRMGFQPTMCVGAVLFMLVSIVTFSLVARFSDLPRLMGAR
ncbi:MAG: ABC transporter permease subunit [Geminicoccaceae bacterium]|nr:MAG: ABC transporter permease subunit [Geminicoccaceae bacterium]